MCAVWSLDRPQGGRLLLPVRYGPAVAMSEKQAAPTATASPSVDRQDVDSGITMKACSPAATCSSRITAANFRQD
jgi:hypothetical protein